MDTIIALAPSIPHFKDLDMRNLQYEIRMFQKNCNIPSHNDNVKLL
jgi:hypothetical protein